MPLTQDDLTKIGSLQMDKLIQFWDEVLEKSIFSKSEAEDLKTNLKKDNQDTRDFIARKVAELGGTSISRDKGLEKRINLTDDKLVDKEIFTTQDGQEIKEIPVFEPHQV